MKFNPTDECVASTRQRQKKAAIPQSKGRVKCITTLVLEDRPKFIPKGKKQREHLVAMGRLKELYFRRMMSAEEVNIIVLEGFKVINLVKFEYLKCQKNNSLIVAENQKLDGNGVIELAGSGCLYLHDVGTNDPNLQRESTPHNSLTNSQQTKDTADRLIANAKAAIERIKVSTADVISSTSYTRNACYYL